MIRYYWVAARVLQKLDKRRKKKTWLSPQLVPNPHSLLLTLQRVAESKISQWKFILLYYLEVGWRVSSKLPAINGSLLYNNAREMPPVPSLRSNWRDEELLPYWSTWRVAADQLGPVSTWLSGPRDVWRVSQMLRGYYHLFVRLNLIQLWERKRGHPQVEKKKKKK